MRDLGSLNGTSLNGRIISTSNRRPGRPWRLNDGDELLLGAHSVVRVEYLPRPVVQARHLQPRTHNPGRARLVSRLGVEAGQMKGRDDSVTCLCSAIVSGAQLTLICYDVCAGRAGCGQSCPACCWRQMSCFLCLRQCCAKLPRHTVEHCNIVMKG